MAHQSLLSTLVTILVALLSLSPRTAANSPVLDTDGNPLEFGSPYYVLTAGWGAAGRGGLTPSSRPPRPCPRYVAQINSEWDNGSPVRFYPPADSSQTQVTEGGDVGIAFRAQPTHCRDSGIWKLTFDEKTMVPYVATYGNIKNPGAETTFKIEKAFGDFSYKIVFCFEQSYMGNIGEKCYQLDATERGPNGVSFLSLVDLDQNLPFFGFVFKKVTTDASYY